MERKEEKTEEYTKQPAALYIPIDQIKENPSNPRNNESAIDKVSRSITRFGFASPIIVNKIDNIIIAGHTRYKAAKKLGLEEVPVRFMQLDPIEAQLLAIADNKLNEVSDWNEKLLSELLSNLPNEDFTEIGFNEAELNDLLNHETEIPEEDFTEDDLDFKFQVIIEDLTEETQASLLERLESEGYKCRPLTI